MDVQFLRCKVFGRLNGSCASHASPRSLGVRIVPVRVRCQPATSGGVGTQLVGSAMKCQALCAVQPLDNKSSLQSGRLDFQSKFWMSLLRAQQSLIPLAAAKATRVDIVLVEQFEVEIAQRSRLV